MGQANARDLVALKRSLQALPALWAGLGAIACRAAAAGRRRIDALAGARRADRDRRARGRAADPDRGRADPARLQRRARRARAHRLRRQGLPRPARGAPSASAAASRTLKVGYNKVFGYYIEVSKARSAAVPADYVRKQTLVNAERYITDELKRFEAQALGAEERRAALELQLFQEVRAEAPRGTTRPIQAVARFLAAVDCLLALAEVADHNGYCRPRILEDGVDPDRGRPPPGGREDDHRRALRAQHDRPRQRREPGARHHRAQHGRQVHGPAPGGAARDHGADGQLRPGPAGRDRDRRPHLHARRRARQPLPRPEHLHGRDAGDRQHPEQRRPAAASSSWTRSAAAPAPSTG